MTERNLDQHVEFLQLSVTVYDTTVIDFFLSIDQKFTCTEISMNERDDMIRDKQSL